MPLSLFLRFRYTPSPHTIFKGVRKLAPGSMLVVEKENAARNAGTISFPRPSPTEEDEEVYEELCDLQRGGKTPPACRRSARHSLSGGLDSGLLLALMKEHGSDWPAYTVGYGRVLRTMNGARLRKPPPVRRAP